MCNSSHYIQILSPNNYGTRLSSSFGSTRINFIQQMYIYIVFVFVQKHHDGWLEITSSTHPFIYLFVYLWKKSKKLVVLLTFSGHSWDKRIHGSSSIWYPGCLSHFLHIFLTIQTAQQHQDEGFNDVGTLFHSWNITGIFYICCVTIR